MGDLGLTQALDRAGIELEGPTHLLRSFPRWFGLHPLFASVDHPTNRPVNRRGEAGCDRQSDADPAEGVAAVGGCQDMAVSWGGRGASLAR